MRDSELYELESANVKLSVSDEENLLTINGRIGAGSLDEMPVSDGFVEAFVDEFCEAALVEDE